MYYFNNVKIANNPVDALKLGQGKLECRIIGIVGRIVMLFNKQHIQGGN